jgi:hypothetical protein
MEKFTCKICGRERDQEQNCGGDCVYCMAEMGDTGCIKRVQHEMNENGGYRSIDTVIVCTLVKHGMPAVPSIQQECDKCSRAVWASHGTIQDAEAESNKNGGQIYYLCMTCVPEAIVGADIRLGKAQDGEIKLAGLNLEELMKNTGRSLPELAMELLKHGRELDKEAKHGRVQN